MSKTRSRDATHNAAPLVTRTIGLFIAIAGQAVARSAPDMDEILAVRLPAKSRFDSVLLTWSNSGKLTLFDGDLQGLGKIKSQKAAGTQLRSTTRIGTAVYWPDVKGRVRRALSD